VTPPLDLVPAGVLKLSDEMRIASANRGMELLVGVPAQELIGQPIDILLSAPSRILFQTHIFPTLKAEGRVDEMLLQLRGRDDRVVPVLFNGQRDDERQPTTYHLVVVRFLTRTRWESDLLDATRALAAERTASDQLTAELRHRHDQDVRNREYRDAFMGVVSHELRTPITTIFGMSHLLQQSFTSLPDATVRQHLADIESEADRLHRLTEDLLVISRVEGARLEIDDEPLQIARLVDRIVKSERVRLPERQFTIKMPAFLPLVTGEDLYVEQVLRNYVSNAAKYGHPETTIVISASAEDGGVAVRVVDEGPGLKDQSVDQLFELFYRAPEAARRTSGAGIGLFVCRELITAMKGRVWAADRHNGAEFGFWLPVLVE